MTKYHGAAGLNNWPLFLTVLEAGKSKFKVVVELVAGESLLPGLGTTVCSRGLSSAHDTEGEVPVFSPYSSYPLWEPHAHNLFPT